MGVKRFNFRASLAHTALMVPSKQRYTTHGVVAFRLSLPANGVPQSFFCRSTLTPNNNTTQHNNNNNNNNHDNNNNSNNNNNRNNNNNDDDDDDDDDHDDDDDDDDDNNECPNISIALFYDGLNALLFFR
ncbi:hypothetical protein HZH66_000104 [Vespula vulgaris]|uniref:Uncharacterized protein n=1 Tax=Vespula vulgaris TaxID=7454 RepID=A0A834KQQ7_VESVU|nr:hypothetical protein HZH66_000104 [Vespula vulgaris]